MPDVTATHPPSADGTNARRLPISFEFFPPKTEGGADKLWECVRRLADWKPDFVSVTCGAGGSAIDGTFAVVRHIRENIGIAVAPHMAMGRQSKARLHAALHEYKKLGIRHVVAIRGDMTKTVDDIPADDVYQNTVDFVADLHADFSIEPIVAAYPDVHPSAESPQQDLDHLKRKVVAGARRAVTQFFFDSATFLRFRDKVRAAGIKVPLIPGIMPIHNLAQVLNFAASCGMTAPAGFGDRFTRWGDDKDAVFNEGVAHATELCNGLRREGVDGFHLYTLNRREMTDAICRQLNAEK